MFKIIVTDIRNVVIQEETIVDQIDACKLNNKLIEKYRAIAQEEDQYQPPYKVLFMKVCMETIL